MANNNTPFGLKPIRHRGGAPYNGGGNWYYINSSYGTALYIGDPVVKTSTANTATVSAAGAGTFLPGTLPEINKATVGTTNKITGAIVAFAASPTALDKVYNPASTERLAFVSDDPDLVYEIQSDLTLAATDVGLNGCLIYTQAGNTNTGLSGAELDGGTTTALATTVGFQLKILRIVNRLDNELAARVKVEVMINNSSESNATVGL